MAKYLIDVNLPYYFSLWQTDDYVHQNDISTTAKDEEIWTYAQQNNLTIVTKDSDFSNRILLKSPPPKVIHLRFGNMKMRDFFVKTANVWDKVLQMNAECKLVSVYNDRIEGVI